MILHKGFLNKIYHSLLKLYDKLPALLPNGLPGDLHHLMLGVQEPRCHQTVLDADHHLLDAIHIDLYKLLDDDEPLPGERKVPRLDQDLVEHHPC